MDVSGTSHLFEDVGMVDTRSQAFVSLPPELQHEILQERQELERHTYTDPGSMPSVSSSCSALYGCICVCVDVQLPCWV